MPGSFARKQISKMYPQRLAFTNRWEDSVSLFYSWLKKEEESVKDKQIPLGDIPAITNAIKDAEVNTNCAIIMQQFYNSHRFADLVEGDEAEEAVNGRALPECGGEIRFRGKQYFPQ